MGSRLLRRAVRRRPPRAAAAPKPSPSPSAGSSADDAALLSCPAPFCPSEGATPCQPDAAVPADCGRRPRREAKRSHTDYDGQAAHDRSTRQRNRQDVCLEGGRPPRQNDAQKAWKKKDPLKVNKFTSKKEAEISVGPHPLADAANQWQRQARRKREEAAQRALTEKAEKTAKVEVGADHLSSEDKKLAPLPSSLSPKQDHGGDSARSSWRQAGREELLAWRRPSRRPPLSSAEPVQEIPSCERRLNKVIAEAGCCSRRKADELIFAGRVSVNGEVERQAGRRISLDDTVCVDGKPLARAQQMLYLMLHKPVQVVSTAADPQGRQTVLSLVAREFPGVRLFPVGRLDYFSEGLILLTNDGRLAQRLMHPRHHLPKLYEVLVRNVVTQKALQTMRSGMRLAEGEELLPVEVTARSTASGCTLLRMVLRQGVNRQIRRMCRDLGLTILRLRRVTVGPLQLGTLAPGHYRPLEEAELVTLRRAVGLR